MKSEIETSFCLISAFAVFVTVLALIVSPSVLAADSRYPPPARDVVSFQPNKSVGQWVGLESGGRARLTNLNPRFGSWYILQLESARFTGSYNLEKPAILDFDGVELALTAQGLVLSARGQSIGCRPLEGRESAFSNTSRTPYIPVCGSTVFWRRFVAGSTSDWNEWGANLLRDTLRPDDAESLIGLVKGARADKERVEGDVKESKNPVQNRDVARPRRARIAAEFASRSLANVPVGIRLNEIEPGEPLMIGEWYTAKNARPGVYVSVLNPGQVAAEILNSGRGIVDALEPQESSAAAYLVAFDLAKYELGWKHGTNYPEAGWSSEPMADRFRQSTEQGPDGFGTFEPLSMTGILNPSLIDRLAAVFCGGFQRKHGVFVYGALAQRNNGSYYGFIENGVVLSRLNPGLATLTVDAAGKVDMKTWAESDSAATAEFRHARQNGVPLVDGIGADGIPTAGALVGFSHWGDAGWSGSVNAKKTNSMRAPRAGLCISEQDGRRYLMYAFFTAVNPSGMARVFQAEGCKYAMHLDMNSLGQGYMGLVVGDVQNMRTENPVPAMSSYNVVTKFKGAPATLPRYVTKPDTVDSFYLMHKAN